MVKKVNKSEPCEPEHDFSLILDGVSELTTEVEDALFESGCDDATLSLQHGCVYAEFSRRAPTLKDAVISAIRNVRQAGLGVLRVDECSLVTASEIARRIGRSRQLVHQYMNGTRGPGGFPPPECQLTEGAPLWAWCAVSYWLASHDIIRPEEAWNAEVVDAVNRQLETMRQLKRHPQLVREIEREIGTSATPASASRRVTRV
jgi:hypothetical protein